MGGGKEEGLLVFQKCGDGTPAATYHTGDAPSWGPGPNRSPAMRGRHGRRVVLVASQSVRLLSTSCLPCHLPVDNPAYES